MSLRGIAFIGCAACLAAPFVLRAEDSAPAAESDEELQQEIRYVELLIESGYPDFAEPVIAATKKKWPESEAKFFAFEVRGMLSLGKFDEAEARIAALPDRAGPKYWAARLEVANNLFFRGKKAECSRIYDEFFKKFPTPTKAIRDFYLQASYAWGQILVGDKRFDEAVKVYESLLKQINRRKSEEDANAWCNVACETAEMYLKLASAVPDPKGRGKYLAPAKKIVDELLWERDRAVYFGRAIAMLANVELLKGDVKKAQETINEYMDQLAELHAAIVEFDPDGKEGVRKLSPMPLCRFMLAKMLWNEAQAEKKKPKPDDEKVKSLLFGEKVGVKRNGAGAYNHALNVFIQYPECNWAADAGDMATRIEEFVLRNYGVKVKTAVTPEQMARVRQMQFQSAYEKAAGGEVEKGIREYFDVLGHCPEEKESVRAIETVVTAYLDLIAGDRENAEAWNWRIDADAVEGYLAERFAGSADKELMTMAGDAVLRIAALEKQRGQLARADRLYRDFFVNYRRHVGAAAIAASMMGEAAKSERWDDAIALCRLIQEHYTNSMYYAASYSQLSYCCSKAGDRAGALEAMKRYVELERDGIAREQARMALAQMYQKEGFEMVSGAETNETPEAVANELRAGSAKIVRGIREFQAFAAKADKALADPSLTKADKARYSLLKEQALFLVGECWRRMTKPEEQLETFRRRAAESYEAYLGAYPEGCFSTNAYVRLGTIYTALGDMAKSKDALDRLSKRFPGSAEAKNAMPQLAKSLIEMGMKKEGTEIYAGMLRTDGAYTAGQFVNAGEVLIEAHSWDLANQAFEKAISKAGTNALHTVARARIGEAKALYRQKSYAEAREAIDLFLADERMSRMAIAVDAYRLLIDVASEQGRAEKDAELRQKDFGAAVAAVKKLRVYWKSRPQWELDSIDLMSADVKIDQMRAEEEMGLKDEAMASCERAASMLQTFLQSHAVDESHPAAKMQAGELANLERCYSTMIPLFAKMGAAQADRVLKYGQEYLDLFPNGRDRQTVLNCMNSAKADVGAPPPSVAGAAEAAESETEGDTNE